MKERQIDLNSDPERMELLRNKFIEQSKKYFGVPYARKYWPPDTPEYNSRIFLDCCGLVRQVLRDLRKEFGFYIGPWNQAYMYDTLPITVDKEEDMRPGDLVFMSGIYTNPKNKKQRHDMTHVEIWLGDGPKTIGSRWNNGKVQVFDSYSFQAKSFHSEKYYFKSIDTWLMGVCHSFCPDHPWKKSVFQPGKKSIFNPDDELGDEDERAGDSDCETDVVCEADDTHKMKKEMSALISVKAEDQVQNNRNPRHSCYHKQIDVSHGNENTEDLPVQINEPTEEKDKFCEDLKHNKVLEHQITKTKATDASNTFDVSVKMFNTLESSDNSDKGDRTKTKATIPTDTFDQIDDSLKMIKTFESSDNLDQDETKKTQAAITSETTFESCDNLDEDERTKVKATISSVNFDQQKETMFESCNYLNADERKKAKATITSETTFESCDYLYEDGRTKAEDTCKEISKGLEHSVCSDDELPTQTGTRIDDIILLDSKLACQKCDGQNREMSHDRQQGRHYSEPLDDIKIENTDIKMNESSEVTDHIPVVHPNSLNEANYSCVISDTSQLIGDECLSEEPDISHFTAQAYKSSTTSTTNLLSTTHNNPSMHMQMSGSYKDNELKNLQHTSLNCKIGSDISTVFDQCNELKNLQKTSLNCEIGSDISTVFEERNELKNFLSTSLDCESTSDVSTVVKSGENFPEEIPSDNLSISTNNNQSMHVQMLGSYKDNDLKHFQNTSLNYEIGSDVSMLVKNDQNISGEILSENFSISKMPSDDERMSVSDSEDFVSPVLSDSCCCNCESDNCLRDAPAFQGIEIWNGLTFTESDSHSSTNITIDNQTYANKMPCSRLDLNLNQVQLLKKNNDNDYWEPSDDRNQEFTNVNHSNVCIGAKEPGGIVEFPRILADDFGSTKVVVEKIQSCPMKDVAQDEPVDSDRGAAGGRRTFSSGDIEGKNEGVSSGSGNGGDGKGEDKGGNKRGGGKRTPGGKTTKLPGCCLPSNMMNTFYIGGGNGVALVEGALLNLGWKRTTDKYDERFKLKWVECKSRINYQSFREGDQLVNHIPNCHLLTNKMGLLNSLQEYERVTLSTKGRPPRLKMVDIVPETYKLDDKNDRETFLEQYKDGEMWICKPTGMNQGKGIFLLRSKEEIDKLLSEREERQQQQRKSTRPLMSRIVQRYIHNPLLLDGRKFDIRAYMLIASTTPFLVVYHKGYVRLSCMPYNGEDTNLTTHLTNQYIQKKDPNYQDVKEDTAWSMDKFNDYINEKVAPEKNLEPNFVYNYLTKQMQRVMLHCFNSVKHKLQTKMGYFDLYGLDFMIDTDMKVWMIEINVNPSLSTNCEALREVIPSVVEESINMSIECFEKSRKNQALMPLNSLKGFTVLYCGSQPNAVQSRQPRSSSPAKDTPEKNPKVTQVSPNRRTVSPSRSFVPRTNATHSMPPIQSKSGTVNTEAELYAKSPYNNAMTNPKPVNIQNKTTHPKPVNKPATTATTPPNDQTSGSKSSPKSTPPSNNPQKSITPSNTPPKSTTSSNTPQKSTTPLTNPPKSTPPLNTPPKSTTLSNSQPKSTTPSNPSSKSPSQGSSPNGEEVKLKMVHKNSVKLKTDSVSNDRGN
ncbi:hypothetical protein SNE40_015721 [Patella caerulea]